MACTPPASASEVFHRAAKCNRLMGRVLIALAVVIAIVLVKGGAEFVRNSTAGLTGTAERIVGFVAIFAAQFTLLLTALFFARRRASAAHHAMVKAASFTSVPSLFVHQKIAPVPAQSAKTATRPHQAAVPAAPGQTPGAGHRAKRSGSESAYLKMF